MKAEEIDPKLSAIVPEVLRRGDYKIIKELVVNNSNVLDLGCGEGDLLTWLVEQKHIEARGVEISPVKVRRCVEHGLSVFQGDINHGLADYPDKCFDYVILSQTLQETHRPLDVLREMVRVGKRLIIAFPNFARWSVPISLLLTGRAPKTRHLPYEWYDSPNIHFVTILDFEEMLVSEGLSIERSYFLRGDRPVRFLRNLRCEVAIYLIRG